MHEFRTHKSPRVIVSPLAQRITIIAAVTAAGAAWLSVRGPLPLIRFMTELPEPVPWWYSLSAFPVLGMLVADWAALARSSGPNLGVLELGAQIIVLVILANLRLGVRIPMSGHVVLLSYFVARRSVLGIADDPIRHLEMGTAAIILLAAVYVKIMWWSDPWTLVLGGVAGVFLAAISWFTVRRRAGNRSATQL